uniref:Uncharacterized protein n=1 Tax=viral metagenome TaxID=1070528 RepID=A0A6M3MGB4_9ZZZZ
MLYDIGWYEGNDGYQDVYCKYCHKKLWTLKNGHLQFSDPNNENEITYQYHKAKKCITQHITQQRLSAEPTSDSRKRCVK